MRLSYQPLTRRWRLVVSPTPIGNSGLALGQTFDTREEALAAVQRISHWKIADAARHRSATSATTSTSASGSTCRSCRGHSRSAPWARPTGIFRSCATSAWPSRARGEHRHAPPEASSRFPLQDFPRLPLGGGRGRRRDRGHRHRAAVPADAGHQQPRAVRAQLRPPVHRQHGGGGRAAAGHPLGGGAAGLAASPRQVRQPPAGQAGRHLRAGGLSARHADLRRVLPVRLALDRKLVRREGGRRARCRPEPGPRHARHPGERPRQQDARGRGTAGRNARCLRAAGAGAPARATVARTT